MHCIMRVIMTLLGILLLAAVAQADEDCLTCHGPIMTGKVQHPGALMGCTTCHALHGTDTGRPYRLNDSVNNLCFQCHDEKTLVGDPGYGGTEGHPITGHPVLGKSDPIHADKEFNCVSCHNPHSSDMKHMFPYQYQDENAPTYSTNMCLTCHGFVGPLQTPVPATPPWIDPSMMPSPSPSPSIQSWLDRVLKSGSKSGCARQAY